MARSIVHNIHKTNTVSYQKRYQDLIKYYLQADTDNYSFFIKQKKSYLILKRIFDIVATFFLLCLFFPLFILCCLMISITSYGVPIYRQRRKGRNQKTFWIYKFRTMYNGAHGKRSFLFEQSDVNGIIFKMKKDPRVTPIGRMLRRYSIDELPQLINVIKGDMSLVGPRPFSVEVFDRAHLEKEIYEIWIKVRHYVLPGMTGLWQVSGRNNLPFEDLIRLDLEYLSKLSFSRDLSIILKTLPTVVKKIGAY